MVVNYKLFILYIYDYDDHDSNFFYIWKGPKGPYSVANLKILECNVKFFLVTDAAPPHLVEILSEDSLKLFKKETEQKFWFYGLVLVMNLDFKLGFWFWTMVHSIG